MVELGTILQGLILAGILWQVRLLHRLDKMVDLHHYRLGVAEKRLGIGGPDSNQCSQGQPTL